MEKNVIIKNLGDISNLPVLPSLSKCRALIQQNTCLRKRTPEQLKSWIDNQRKNKIRKKKYKRNKNIELLRKK